MASAPDRIARFGRTERLAHWLMALGFVVLLASGLALNQPFFADYVARPVARGVHLWAVIALTASLIFVARTGNGRALRGVARDLDRLDSDDVRWLAEAPQRLVSRRPAPRQGRFNAGQKLNAAILGGMWVVLYGTGIMMWLAETRASFRLAGTVYVHDLATYAMTVLVLAHIYKAAISPSTRAALRGSIHGDVDRAYAERHHSKWVDATQADATQADERSDP